MLLPLNFDNNSFYFNFFQKRQFIDWKKVILKAGNGGNGCLHFKRQKYQPRAGPDGGDGGRGGSVILIADYSVKEFAHLPKHIKAENGGAGKADDCKGKNGSDQMWQVNYKLIGSQT